MKTIGKTNGLLLSACLCVGGLALAGGCSSAKDAPLGPATSPVLSADASMHAPVPAARPADELVDKLMKESRWDEWAQVPAVLQLSGAPLEAWNAKQAAWKVKMAALEAAPSRVKANELKTQLKAARDAKDEAKVAQLDPEFKAAEEAYFKGRSAIRTELLSNLSAEQQRYWVQFALYRDLRGSLTKYTLTPEQEDKLWKLCAAPAQKMVGEGVIASDPYVKASAVRTQLRETAVADVLTGEQREKMPKPTTMAK